MLCDFTFPNTWRHAEMPGKDKRVPAVQQLPRTWWLVGIIYGVTTVTQPQLILEGMNARQVGVGWRGGKGTMLSFSLYVSIFLDLAGKILEEKHGINTYCQ
jgi:hypothetical protein